MKSFMSGALKEITPASACPALIPNLFQESALGREAGRRRSEKNTGRKAGGPELHPASVCMCPGCVVLEPGRANSWSAFLPLQCGQSSLRAPTPAEEPTCCSPMHCVRRDLLWPPLLPGSSILVGIHLSACATHTLHTHGDCKRAASIVAPLRQTQTDIFLTLLSNLPSVQQLQRGREKEKESERREKLIRN